MIIKFNKIFLEKSYSLSKIFHLRSIFLILYAVSFYDCRAQNNTGFERIIENVKSDLKKYYVLDEVSFRMCDSIEYRFRHGLYDVAKNEDEFCYLITQDIRRVSRDKHLLILPKPDAKTGLPISQLQQGKKEDSSKNNGSQLNSEADKNMFGCVAIFPNAVGYVSIKGFLETEISRNEKKTPILDFERVFSFLKNTNSIIMDFRDNSGGKIQQALVLSSYFCKPNTYLVTKKRKFYYEMNGVKSYDLIENQLFSIPVKDKLLKGKKIFILANSRTFSSAEIAINIIKKQISDVVVIGERTLGGTNGNDGLNAYQNYYGIIPSSVFYNSEDSNIKFDLPIVPQIITSSDSAFAKAYFLASGTSFELYFTQKGKYLFKEQQNSSVSNDKLKAEDYVGNYLKVEIAEVNGQLELYYDIYSKHNMILKTENVFEIEGFATLKFSREDSQEISKVEILHSEGWTETFYKRKK